MSHSFPVNRVSGHKIICTRDAFPTGPELVIPQDTANLVSEIHLSTSPHKSGWVRIPAIAYTSDGPPDSVLDVPLHHNSPQALLYCGFSTEATERIMGECAVRAAQEKESERLFFSSVEDLDVVEEGMEYLQRMGETSDYQDAWGQRKWEQALKCLGLANDMIASILTPQYAQIRNLGEPLDWAIDSVSNNLSFLNSLGRRIRHRARLLERYTRRKLRDTYRPTPIPRSQRGRRPVFLPFHTHRLESAAGIVWLKQTCLLKVGDFVDQDCDFGGGEELRFYLDEEVARAMAGFMACRMRSRDATLVYSFVPDKWFDAAASGLASTDIEGEDWEDFVFFSRVENRPAKWNTKTPRSLKPYEEADVLVGPVCGFSPEKIKSMPRRHGLQVLAHPKTNNPAMQMVFKSQKARECFSDECLLPVGYCQMGTEEKLDYLRKNPPHSEFTHVFEEKSSLEMRFIKEEDICRTDWEAKAPTGWNGWRWPTMPLKIKGFVEVDGKWRKVKKEGIESARPSLPASEKPANPDPSSRESAATLTPNSTAPSRLAPSEPTPTPTPTPAPAPNSPAMKTQSHRPMASPQNCLLTGGFLMLN